LLCPLHSKKIKNLIALNHEQKWLSKGEEVCKKIKNLIALNHEQKWLSKGEEERFAFYWEQDQHDFYKNRKRNSLVGKRELVLTSTRRNQFDLCFTELREEQRRHTAEQRIWWREGEITHVVLC
jgi:hypothetical protein